MGLKRSHTFGLLITGLIFASAIAAHSTLAAGSEHVSAGTVPTLPHKISDMGVVVEPPAVASHLTRDEAVKAAIKLLPTSIQSPETAVVATNYVTYRDRGEFVNGIHAWVISFKVNVPKVSGVPGDGVHPAVTNYGHADSMDVVVDDLAGVPLRNYVHGVWDKSVTCFADGRCETTYH